ncbi:2-oxoglutarate-dependent dioxygenase AOP2-like isoform X5 [Malus sylvestris]|uniref:2-oxoglutarate-dependent dioxygenase AOP2-like isoform X5 n=1 Tax=Malus sylvestris TaxID=3752 RepID=UPI0021AC17CB|nr:2-oxoglutarate-dependent dioxygenase AOP2-like isoform X5 [Malus sylvestris]
MGSDSETASLKIPIIDFTNSGSDTTPDQVRHALEEYGCFVAAYDRVPAQLVDKVMAQSKDLFDLPTETKLSHTGDDVLRGYIGPSPRLPYSETFAISHATSFQDVQNFMNLVWPAGKDNFCETTHSYVKLIEELGERVMRLLFESYGVAAKHYESFAAFNDHIFRLIKYREMKDIDITGTSVWFPSHTDASFISILFQHQIGGLEIESKDGTFVGIDASPCHFIVFAGDMLQIRWIEENQMTEIKNGIWITPQMKKTNATLTTFVISHLYNLSNKSTDNTPNEKD